MTRSLKLSLGDRNLSLSRHLPWITGTLLLTSFSIGFSEEVTPSSPETVTLEGTSTPRSLVGVYTGKERKLLGIAKSDENGLWQLGVAANQIDCKLEAVSDEGKIVTITSQPEAKECAETGTGDALIPVGACDNLKQYLVYNTVKDASATRYYYRGPWMTALTDAAAGASSPSAEGSVGGNADKGSLNYSTTTIQELGVDEPDIIKNDGDYIYLINNNELAILNAWPADQTKEIARVKIEGTPQSLLLEKDVAAVFSYLWNPNNDTFPEDFVPHSWSMTKVTLLDLKDRSNPTVLRELYFEGDYRDARLVDGKAHLVIATYLNFENYYYYPVLYAAKAGEAAGKMIAPVNPAIERQSLRSYRHKLLTKKISEMSPRYLDRRHQNGKVERRSAAITTCDQVYRTAVPDGRNTLTVVTLDLKAPMEDTQSATILSDSGTVYGSLDNLYVTVPHYYYWWNTIDAAGQTENLEESSIHKFHLGSAPEHVASGIVPGYPLNQYAMSEYQDIFRIATTVNHWGSESGPENAIYTFKQDDDQMRIIGSLKGLGKKGERIYAVRFLGERGFVVTYEQIDPLYTIDLKDPAEPKVMGALEVPGFSTFLMPVSQDKIFSVGNDPRGEGLQISLFDIADFANPKLLDRESFGAGSYSQALYDPKALTYLDATQTIALPVTVWQYNKDETGNYMSSNLAFNGLYLYGIDPAEGFNLLGKVDHSNLVDTSASLPSWYSYPMEIQRSVLIGQDQNNFLYTFSQAGIKVNRLDDLSHEVATVKLPGATIPCCFMPIDDLPMDAELSTPVLEKRN